MKLPTINYRYWRGSWGCPTPFPFVCFHLVFKHGKYRSYFFKFGSFRLQWSVSWY